MKQIILITMLLLSPNLATGGAQNLAGADVGMTEPTAAITQQNTEFNKADHAANISDMFTAKPQDYMLDMMAGIIGGQAMSYVFSSAKGTNGASLFEGYQVKEGTAPTTVFTYVLGLLLEAIILCGALLISWSYLLTSAATAQDGEFLGKKGDSSFLPFRTGMSVVSIAPIEAFGGLSLMQYIVVCAMSLGVVVAGYLSSGVVNFTIDRSLSEMRAELKTNDIAPVIRNVLDADAACYFTAQKTGKTVYNEEKAVDSMDGDWFRNGVNIHLCKVDRSENILSFFFDAFSPDFMVTLETPQSLKERSGRWVPPSERDVNFNASSLQNVDDMTTIIMREAAKSREMVASNMMELFKIMDANDKFKQFRKSIQLQLGEKYLSMIDPNHTPREGLETLRYKDIKLFDDAVREITRDFNEVALSEYKEPDKLYAYAERLKETMNSEGFATLGGTVFSLTSIATAVKTSAAEALPRTSKTYSMAEIGITDKETLIEYSELMGYYRKLYQGSVHPQFTMLKADHSISTTMNSDDLFNYSTMKDDISDSNTLLYMMGFDSQYQNKGLPLMFELRNMGNNALAYAATLSGVMAFAQASDVVASKTGFAGMATMAVLKGFVSLLAALIPYLFILGGVLAFVLPALPWFFWVTAIVGLVIFFAEALIAINIWAIALAHPDGEGPTSQSSSQGLQLLIRLTFQPSVMVAAFAFAMVAVDVVGGFVTTLTFSVLDGSFSSMFEGVGVVSMYMLIMLSITWTIYGTLSTMSSQVFSWIGHASHDIGEQKGEQNFIAAINSTKQASHASSAFAASGRGGGEKENQPTKKAKGASE